jgi:ribosome-associated translation inhibitor RaiA
MDIQVNHGHVKKSDLIDQYAQERVMKELAHMADRITRVEVHLGEDSHAHKSGGHDKRCMIEARPSGRQPIAVEHKGDDMKLVIAEAAGKLGRALHHAFDKHK